jgi:hypothetical protein
MAPSAVQADSQEIVVKQVKPMEKTALQMISQGISLPPIPSFTDFELHRHWILEHMVGTSKTDQLKIYA